MKGIVEWMRREVLPRASWTQSTESLVAFRAGDHQSGTSGLAEARRTGRSVVCVYLEGRVELAALSNTPEEAWAVVCQFERRIVKAEPGGSVVNCTQTDEVMTITVGPDQTLWGGKELEEEVSIFDLQIRRSVEYLRSARRLNSNLTTQQLLEYFVAEVKKFILATPPTPERN